MFESAELGHRISKKAFKEAVPELREALLQAQFELNQERKFPVIILVSGEDGAGKSETINLFYEWMDPRYLSTLAFSSPTEEEAQWPYMWRFWRALPPKGRVGFFAGSWYSLPIQNRIEGVCTQEKLDTRIDQINRFEAMLANEGALVLKFWFHLSKDGQKRRLKALEADPKTAWRVTPWHWARLKTHDRLQDVAGHVLRMTNTPWAPWTIIDGEDDCYRSLTAGQTLLQALRQRLVEAASATTQVARLTVPNLDGRDVLTALKLDTKPLKKAAYEKTLAHWQGRLAELARDPRFADKALVCAFEGSDAAGKGGSIRRIAQALDPRQFHIVPIASPTEEERAQPYLWRFWRHIPRKGRVTIFDRTWYGRVLVERVEGFCAEADWLRAYSEINDFEHEMRESGVVVVKFWLQISQDEQLRRFKEREKIAFKRFKITEEDWRNREKWDAYHEAVCDMVERTSTGNAPWTLVEANDKYAARIKVLRTVCEQLEAALDSPDSAAEMSQAAGSEGASEKISRRATKNARKSPRKNTGAKKTGRQGDGV